jgi:hypothetical protein
LKSHQPNEPKLPKNEERISIQRKGRKNLSRFLNFVTVFLNSQVAGNALFMGF